MPSIIASWKIFISSSPHFDLNCHDVFFMIDVSIFNAITWESRWFRLRASTVSKKKREDSCIKQPYRRSFLKMIYRAAPCTIHGPVNVIWSLCRTLSIAESDSRRSFRGRPIWLHSLNALRLPISVSSLFARVLVHAAPRYRGSGIWSKLLVSRKGRRAEKGKTKKNKEENKKDSLVGRTAIRS